MLRYVNITRYITPLREGGSLPAIAEADDEFLYVLKFRGAGQGTKALIAELLGCEIARALGMRVPELVFAHLDEGFGRMERDEEIQDLLKFSVGLNLGISYLSGAISYDPTVNMVDTSVASTIVWLDCMLMNVDRTAKNTNMLIWNRQLWLIDHGASLYFHHGPQDWNEQAKKPFTLIKDHVLLRQASQMEEVNANAQINLTPSRIGEIVSFIPDSWLMEGISFDEQRARYAQYFSVRLANAAVFINEANHAREALI
ncbi:MAG: HipA family kinase [Saprospiraceae bacterium]|nr:HipA family kinase [Saprospiraceae bacterium]